MGALSEEKVLCAVRELVKNEPEHAQQALDALSAGMDIIGEKFDTFEYFVGDLIFAVTNVSRFVKVDSERAAEKTCNKFVRRFADMEQQAKAQGKQLSELTLEEMDALWDEAKKKEHRE